MQGNSVISWLLVNTNITVINDFHMEILFPPPLRAKLTSTGFVTKNNSANRVTFEVDRKIL